MTLNTETLLAGEKAFENAPQTALADGRRCVPQHYLSYQHTLQSVESLVFDIEYDVRYPVFVSQTLNDDEQAGLYIQVGILGVDNYGKHESPTKLVYGRKWRIEPQLPSSEIIQTVFLALKKAREHEVRELFRLQLEEKTTTPFNNHHDLPLLAHSEKRLLDTSNASESDFCQQLEHILKCVNYDSQKFELLEFTKRPRGQYLVDLLITPDKESQLTKNKADEISLPEMQSQTHISFFIEKLSINQFLHQLMQQLIDLSNRHVDEHFRYRGFNRFSWDNSVKAIAEISAEVRQLHKDETLDNFHQHWQRTNYETDRSRIPTPAPGDLWDKIHRQLKPFSPQAHTLPINLV